MTEIRSPTPASTPPPLPSPRFGGFWLRSLAHLIDSTLFSMIITPILFIFILPDFLELVARAQRNPDLVDPLGILKILHSPVGLIIQYGIPSIAVILLWRWRSATPGKMILNLKIVDAETFGKPSTTQLLIRFFGYIASMIPACLGFLWVAWDPRKQGWHDKLARTVVVRG
ncbi:MAG: RDD family protein [Verrucomicrobiales bacterium]